MDEAQAWRDLAAHFAKLGEDESHRLYASWHPIAFYADDCHWTLSGTSDAEIHRRFRIHVERAAALRGGPDGPAAIPWWLDLLKEGGHRYDGGLRIAHGGRDGEPGEWEEHGVIRSVCLASSECCYGLETDAIANERRQWKIVGPSEEVRAMKDLARALERQHFASILTPRPPMDHLNRTREENVIVPQSPAHSTDESGITHMHLRRERVNDFLGRCNRLSDTRVIRKHIWQLIGHSKGRQFEYWQKSDPKATAEDERNFERVLKMDPGDFLDQIRKRGMIK
jgi:hypothetical protein